jgi:hypothetical protein
MSRGCACQGCSGAAPVANAPGQDRIAYRVGDHATFLGQLERRLSGKDHRELAGLRTRDAADPTIALLDAWAAVADVLAFYQERIANQGYLRTATEQRSLEELGALVGYRARPGLAASTYVAFTIDPTVTDGVEIPARLRVQSVPARADQVPQVFETAGAVFAKPRWNVLQPTLLEAQTAPAGVAEGAAPEAIWVRGRVTSVVGDRLLVGAASDTGRALRTVERVAYLDPFDLTEIGLSTVAGDTTAARQAIEAILASARPFLDRAAARDLVARIMPHLGALAAGRRPAPVLGAVRREITAAADRLPDAAVVLRAWLAEAQAMVPTLDPEVPSAPPAQDEGRATASGPARADQLVTFARKAPSVQPQDLARVTAGRGPQDVLGGNVSSGQIPSAVVEVLKRDSPLAGRMIPSALASPALDPGTGIEADFLTAAAVFGRTAPPIFRTDDDDLPQQPVDPVQPVEVALLATGGEDRSLFTAGSVLVRVDDIAGGSLSRMLQTPGNTSIEVGGHIVDVVALPSAAGETKIRFQIAVDGTLLLELSEPVPAGTPIGTVAAVAASSGQELRLAVLPKPFAFDVVALDARYDAVLPGRPIVLEDTVTGTPRIMQVVAAGPAGVSAFRLTNTVTVVTLDQPWIRSPHELSSLRNLAVWAAPQPLPIGARPIDTPVGDESIVLDGLLDDLRPGHQIVVQGRRLITPEEGGDRLDSGVTAAERAMVSNVRTTTLPDGRAITAIYLAEPLAYEFVRDTVHIFGNVVGATHGESRHDVLGDGDASRPFPQFPLPSGPLTYVPSAVGTGAASTLDVAVNGLAWTEVSDLIGSGPADRHYVTERIGETTTITAGDGRTGMRPPTGHANVEARYRLGIGAGGNLEPGQLSLLVDHPRGALEVVNPVPATGGVDPDRPDSMRERIPLTLRVLDRLVAAADYEDFARLYAGVGQARVDQDPTGVFVVTIVPAADVELAADSELLRGLRRAIAERGDPSIPAEVVPFERSLIFCALDVAIAADRYWEDVEPAVRAAVLDAFGFEHRRLGAPADPDDVLAAAVRVRGVVAAEVVALGAVPTRSTVTEATQALADIVYGPGGLIAGGSVGRPRVGRRAAARGAVAVGGSRGAELLYLSAAIPDSLLLRQWTTAEPGR